jgi:hypothetical protein
MKNRDSVPLVMLPGNLEILMNEPLFCNCIKLIPHPDSQGGVMLQISMNAAQRAHAADIGFVTEKLPWDSYGGGIIDQQ